MPRSLWRMAGRAPKIWALRTSNFGNVSALAAAFGATAQSSREAAPAGATLTPRRPVGTILLSRYENTARRRSSIEIREQTVLQGSRYSAALRKASDPDKNWSRRAASSAFAAATWRSLTGTYPTLI